METVYNMFNSFISLLKTFGFSDLFDIIIIAFIIYHFIKLVRETRAGQLVKGILILIFAYAMSSELKFRMLSGLLNNFFQFGIIALLVVFQPELRRALEQIGRSKLSTYLRSASTGEYEAVYLRIKSCIDNIIDTSMLFSQTRTGALVVFERQTKLGDIVDTGTIVNAMASVPLIGNIFFNKAPLHDGAMIVRDGTIYAAGCILPLTKNENISLDLGTRHRAALGISEISDAVALVVSEETGSISVTQNGIIRRDLEKDELRNILYKELLLSEVNDKNTKKIFVSLKTLIKKKKGTVNNVENKIQD